MNERVSFISPSMIKLGSIKLSQIGDKAEESQGWDGNDAPRVESAKKNEIRPSL
jgi:hypothetical protein